MTAGSADGAAPEPTVAPGLTVDLQTQRREYADEAEQAVRTIEAKIAGMKESLATAKADAKRLRAEADKGGEG